MVKKHTSKKGKLQKRRKLPKMERKLWRSESQHLSWLIKQRKVHLNKQQKVEKVLLILKKRLGASRGVSSLHNVLVKKAHGKRFRVQYNQFGEPVGDTRCTLQSYIGHLARTMIPIDIDSWPRVDRELKEKLWLDVKVIKYT